MELPLLAGKVAALSLSALPLSYALSLISALSQYVRGGLAPGGGAGGVGGGDTWGG